MVLKVDRNIGRLLITGVPGWLTGALLASFVESEPQGLTSMRCLVQRQLSIDADLFLRDYPLEMEIVYGDLRDADSLSTALRGVDTVLHSGAILHVRHTRDWYETNSSGTKKLAAEAVKAGVERFVFISSNAAAGRSDSYDHLRTEAEKPRPLSHYGKSKWLAEQAVNALQAQMETVILRPCMFYGPPVPKRHIDVYQRILDGRMPLVGDGNFARSLSHIDNLVQGSLLALTHPAAVGQTYYIADRLVYTTRQVTEAMAKALKVIPRFIQLPRLMAPLAYNLDMTLAAAGFYLQTLHLVGEADWHVGVSIEKACRELGYDPKVELFEGMQQAVDWCRSKGLIRLE